ncbi:MAG: glycoside hydrolase family 16 protein, partial [Chitinophagales bacterium]
MYRLILLLLVAFGTSNKICSQVDIVYSKLVWSDEFNTNGAIESSKWYHQTILPNGNSWFNGELQHYTDLTTNSFVDNGFLNIVAKKENYTNQSVTKNYTSARLNSKFAFTYGRVDVRAKMPIDKGTWPAIWLLGKNIIETGGYFSAQYGTTHWP